MIKLTQNDTQTTYLPAEWETQSGIQLTWPHAGTDWQPVLKDVEKCFIQIARNIAKEEKVLIVTPCPNNVKQRIETWINMDNVIFLQCSTNDTWARDHGAITIMHNNSPILLDFKFNGWGNKYPYEYDNLITIHGVRKGALHGRYRDCSDFVLEGGSIESDGTGTLLTTSKCLLSNNRNNKKDKLEIESYLLSAFNLKRVLWLDHGYLKGDDTDGHIDTLARFCSTDTIAYTQCTNPNDEHYPGLQLMEDQLKDFRTISGKPYNLLPFPLPDPIIENGERLPATYVNFLIINNAVLYPTYNQTTNDKRVGEILKEAFPNRKIIGVDCRVLIKQHGSLHCLAMQYPVGVLETNTSQIYQ